MHNNSRRAELDEQRRAEKRAVEAQKNKKQKAEKEAKLEVLKRSKYGSSGIVMQIINLK